MACVQDLVQCLDGSCIYTCVPTHQQHMAATLLRDNKWLDNKFFPENIKRLSEAHRYTVDTLGEIGIQAFRAKVKTYSGNYLRKPFIYLSPFFNFRLDSLYGWILENI